MGINTSYENKHIPIGTSEAISYSRFLLCIMVVVIHSRFDTNVEIKAGEVVSDWVPVIIHVISEILCTIAVPIFMMFSGYLLFFKYKNSNGIKKLYIANLLKKSVSLLLPYLIWNTIGWIWLLLRSIEKGDNSIYVPNIIETFTYVPKDGNFGLYPADGPLWFIRDLIIFNILSPLIYYVLKVRTRYWLYVIILLMIIVKIPHFLTFNRSIPPFILGATLGLLEYDIPQYIYRYRYFIILTTIVSFCICSTLSVSGSHIYIFYNIFLT